MSTSKPVVIAGAVGLLLAFGPALSQQSKSQTMDFEQCLRTIRELSSELRVAPINIAETNDMRMVRFPTADGSVLVTCSRPDRKMVVTVNKR